jgi:hypothetical protein
MGLNFSFIDGPVRGRRGSSRPIRVRGDYVINPTVLPASPLAHNPERQVQHLPDADPSTRSPCGDPFLVALTRLAKLLLTSKSLDATPQRSIAAMACDSHDLTVTNTQVSLRGEFHEPR